MVYGCTDSTAFNYDATTNTTNTPDGSCVPVVNGCTNPTALNYDDTANTDDGSCILICCRSDDSCSLRPETMGCPSPECPQECSNYFDGCNRCTCTTNDGPRCTKRLCFNYTGFVCHDNEPDEPDELEYNCQLHGLWTLEQRQWCCINERVGCCPQVRCRAPPVNCNRTTWPQEVNQHGCLVYPCGVDRCPQRPRTNPGIILRDDRGVERMKTNWPSFENEGLDAARVNEDRRVVVRVRDDRGRTRVEMVPSLNMTTSEDVVRRRNVISEVLDALGTFTMSVSESGLTSLQNSRAESVVVQAHKVKPVNATNCTDADIDIFNFEDDAYEIVLGARKEQFMACYDKKLLALVTLQNINPNGRSEYSVECWRLSKWEFVDLMSEGDTFTCPELPDYTFEIASVAGLTYVRPTSPEPYTPRTTVANIPSDLEIPTVIVSTIVIIVVALSVVCCKSKKPKKSKNLIVVVTSQEVNDLKERLLEKPLKWVP